MSELQEAKKKRLESLMKRYKAMEKWSETATVEEYDRYYPEIKKLLDQIAKLDYEMNEVE